MKAFGGGTRRLALMALGRGNGAKRRYILTKQEVRRENSPVSRLVSQGGWREREGVLANNPLRTIQDLTVQRQKQPPQSPPSTE
ncbi:hypothetical protein E2C01_048095 [Portunus trituberculatus]|uniref:Uncharacterized protein n=1 Tax=Portunus trituberculatus TaxID=210409 RepID=A0A5B7G9N9_PORTR|nr:hypothetical protein [Portunus trituberculatus]